jgi:hypothetical protein
MSRSLPRLAALAASLPAVLLPAAASAADSPTRDIPIESWSFGSPASTSDASRGGGGAGKLSFSPAAGPSGTGKTMAAEVLA